MGLLAHLLTYFFSQRKRKPTPNGEKHIRVLSHKLIKIGVLHKHMLKVNQFIISFLAAQLCKEIYLLLPASTAK